MLPSTKDRVPRHTSPRVNRRIRETTERRIRRLRGAGGPAVRRRLLELDREWDIERAIEANASSLALAGTLLGIFVNRWFLALPVAVTGFLLQHALQGWCPPVPVLRRMGFRTANEIFEERAALSAVRPRPARRA